MKNNTNNSTADENVALRINGSLMGVAIKPDLDDLEAALRGVALSDSPVLLRGAEDVCHGLLEHLHRLGRRAELPMHSCHSPEDAEDLFKSVLDDSEPSDGSLGTWALFRVEAWPRELQVSLSEAFAERGASMFDRGRYTEAFQGWVSGFKLDSTNPKVRAGLARLERRAETLAQEAELSGQRGDPAICDKWKQVTRITRAQTDVHKKARERALALCR